MELSQMLNATAENPPIVDDSSYKKEDEVVEEGKIVACPKDIKQCPDGTTLTRKSKNGCKFDDCPPVRVNEMKLEKGILGLDYKTVLLGVAVLVVGYFIIKKSK